MVLIDIGNAEEVYAFRSLDSDRSSSQCVVESMGPIFGNEIGSDPFFFQQVDKWCEMMRVAEKQDFRSDRWRKLMAVFRK